jgi:hypothetical protein
MIEAALRRGGFDHPTSIRISQIHGGGFDIAKAQEVLTETLVNAVESLGGRITDFEKGFEGGMPWIRANIRY